MKQNNDRQLYQINEEYQAMSRKEAHERDPRAGLQNPTTKLGQVREREMQEVRDGRGAAL